MPVCHCFAANEELDVPAEFKNIYAMMKYNVLLFTTYGFGMIFTKHLTCLS